jgi:hypothetical protein
MGGHNVPEVEGDVWFQSPIPPPQFLTPLPRHPAFRGAIHEGMANGTVPLHR